MLNALVEGEMSKPMSESNPTTAATSTTASNTTTSAGPIIVIDTSEIREGKLAELEASITGLADFVETQEPRALAYHVYLNEEKTRMTVLQVHPDAASTEFHMEVAREAFAKFVELVRLVQMDVYGEPSDRLLGQLRRKVQLLGEAAIVVHELHGGFARFARAESANETPREVQDVRKSA